MVLCPDIDELESFAANGDGGASSSIDLRRHLDECSSCRERLTEVHENLQLAGSLRRAVGGGRLRTAAAPPVVEGCQVLRELGRGGMGTVYAAQQERPHRVVAIKVLHAAAESDGTSDRMFRREVDALGRLRHPAIAAIHGAGRTADQRPYLMMEFVDGRPLREFLAEARPTVRDRVILFKRVCDAIAYAHQRGVIHRDIKPSNILVVDEAGPASRGRGIPKVLDFGLAKIVAADRPLGATFETEIGRVAGTLPYMSPEQVRGDAADMDARSDVYSLGVVLYEMLVGRLPYQVDQSRLIESARTICESAPESPSRSVRELRGDLETIILKALEKEPGRRYAGAAALSDDLGRFLADEPVLARPATLRYQVGKLVRRHKLASGLAAVLVVSLAGFAAAMSLLYERSQRQFHRAEAAEKLAQSEAASARREAATARRVKDLLVALFKVSEPQRAQGRDVSARELLDRGAARLESGSTGDPLVDAGLAEAIGMVYEKLGLLEKSRPLLERSLAIWRERVEPDGREIGRVAIMLGDVQRKLGRLEEAEANYRLALDVVRKHFGPDDRHMAAAMTNLADIQLDRGDAAGAEATLREQLAVLRSAPEGAPMIDGCLNSLGGALEAQGKYDEAAAVIREALSRDSHSGDSLRRASFENNLAWVLIQAGRLDEAEPLVKSALRRRQSVLDPTHPAIASSLTVMGALHLKREHWPEAERALQESSRVRRRLWPNGSDQLAETIGLLGESIGRQSRPDEAEPLLLESLDMARRLAPADGLGVREAARRLAEFYDRAGLGAKAAPHWETALGRADGPP